MLTSKKIAIKLRPSSTIILTGLLVACGGTGQDNGSSNPAPKTIELNGVALDGRLARSTVYIDTNNNGTRDPWEPFAFTDNEGYYSFNPNTNVNYCSENADASQSQYCLRFNSTLDNTIVRVDGGYDRATGEPFLGQLSRRLSNESLSEVTTAVISPLTSLLTEIETNQDKSIILNSLNITESDLDIDYYDAGGNNSIDTKLLNNALKIHKVVTVLSDRLTDTYDEIGEQSKTPNDASPNVYPNLASQIITNLENTPSQTLDLILSDSASLINVLDNTETQLRDIYTQQEIDLPLDMGDTSNPNQFTRVVDIATRIPNVIDNLIPSNTTPIANTDMDGRTKALEILIVKTVNEENIDSTIDNTITFFSDNTRTDTLNTLINQLNPESASINPLINFGFSDTQTTPENIETVVQSGVGDTPFLTIGGQTLKISDLDLGSEPNDLRDIEAEFYFQGDSNAEEGELTVCIKVMEDISRNTPNIGSSNTRGALATGFWSKLKPDAQGQTYNLLMTLSFLGSTYQTIIKNTPRQTTNDPVTGEPTLYHTVRADTDGETDIFFSEDGLIQTSILPSTDLECEQRLPSRINF